MILQAPNISDLHPVIPPEPVVFTPVTIGWYALAVVLLVALAAFAWSRYKKWLKNKYRRDGIKILHSKIDPILRQPDKRGTGIRELSELLKTIAFQSWPREKIASLSGRAWTTFLTESCSKTNFGEMPGSLLQEAQYLPDDKLAKIDDEQIHQLISIAKKWIGGHRV